MPEVLNGAKPLSGKSAFALGLAGVLLLIGVVLIADGMGEAVPKGYLYFAMAFAVFVELLNIRYRKVSAAPVQLHETLKGPGA